MKDTEGSLVHARTSASTTLMTPTPPSRAVTIVDTLRQPLPEVGGLVASAAVAWWSWPVMDALPGGLAKVGMLGVGMVSSILAAFLLLVTIWNQVVTNESFLHAGLARLSRRTSIAVRAADTIRAEWDRATIRTSEKSQYGYGGEKRAMEIALPEGARVHVLHRREGRPLVVLQPRAVGYHDFDPAAALGMVATATIMDAITRIQTDRLSFLLGVRQGLSPHAMSRMLGEILPCDSDDEQRDMGGMDFMHTRHVPELHLVETRLLKGAEIRVVSIRPKNDDDHSEVFVDAPGIGIMALPVEEFSRIMARRRRTALRIAFGDVATTAVAVPVFVGNARASRIADLARQALREDPALTDASGSPIRSLIEEHMPRLISVHRDSTRTARTSDIAEIDAVLDRGLDIVARALGDAIEGLNDRKLDALRTEVRFLESRHPDHAASPLSLHAA